MAFVETFLEIFERPTTWAVMMGVIKLLVPVWVAFLFGIIVGWAWKPRWGSLKNSKFNISAPSSPSAANAKVPCFASLVSNDVVEKEQMASSDCNDDVGSLSKSRKEEEALVNDDDLEYLCHLVERNDGGPSWKHMMDHSTQTMSYQAWQREPKNGPPQYCSRTVYEDATPELMRDFFWDDEFRMKWDNMLVHAEILEECPSTGNMMVHWIRKFPFFCSDREYIIGRRMWESGKSYYCVTKGVPCSSVPRKEKPRRVDLYYSSWFIQAVESRKGNGQSSSACEVILFHYEDMGIPWEVAKFGVRQGMWGTVKNIEKGFRAYQKHRASSAPLTHHALMAQICTKLDQDYLKVLEGSEVGSTETQLLAPSAEEKTKGGVHIPKLLIVGGAILVACSLDRGLLTKTLVYGVARRFGNMGRRGISGAR